MITSPEAKEFGAYIRRIRTDRKITIREVQDATGISNGYLSLVETGKRDIPTPDILRKLSKVLGVPYYHLMKKAGYLDEGDQFEEIELEQLLKSARVALNGKSLTDAEKQRILDVVTGVFWETHGKQPPSKDTSA